MAQKRQNKKQKIDGTPQKTKGKDGFAPDLEMLTHKYSDYYQGYVLYDVQRINYPVYRTKVRYLASKEQELHPIVMQLLKTLDFLQTIKTDSRYALLQQITQMDTEILAGILSEFALKGYLKQESDLAPTQKAMTALKKATEKISEEFSAHINIDGVLGEALVIDSENLSKGRDKDSIEFKPSSNARPRTEYLDELFSDEKTLRQIIIEELKTGNAGESTKGWDIDDIVFIDPDKRFCKYICLFYKNSEEAEKILVINKNYDIDTDATDLFERLVAEQKFTDHIDTSSNKYAELNENFNEKTPEIIVQELEPPDLTEGKTIEVGEHKKYFKYVLQNAKKEICIQSPWIRNDVLKLYEEDIKSALDRGVNVTIKYGMKPRNRFDKVGIDETSKKFFATLDKSKFTLIESDDHSKIIICDEAFMIMGSFNWLSFGGGRKKGEDTRGETSTVNRNKEEIKKQKEKFRK